MPLPRFARAFAAVMALASVASASAAPGCAPVRAATTKLATVPSHQTSFYQQGSTRLMALESVIMGGQTWTRGDATSPWEKEPTKLGKGLQELEKADCRYLRDDSTDGGAVAVYEVRHINGDASDNQPTEMWISKASGLPVRLVVGDAAKSVTTKFDYRDVKPPAR